jgi:hypothetical protein
MASSAYKTLGARSNPNLSSNPEAPKHHTASAHCEASAGHRNIVFQLGKSREQQGTEKKYKLSKLESQLGIFGECQASLEPGYCGPFELATPATTDLCLISLVKQAFTPALHVI